MSSPGDFISAMLPYAVGIQRQTGLPAAAMIAQAALETGWGKSVLPNSNNLFNIKGEGPAGSVLLNDAWEVQDGQNVYRTGSFRAYRDYGESFADYADLIRTDPRYASAVDVKSDLAAYAQALQDAGYATDPNYAEQIIAILNQYDLVNEVTRYMADHPFTDIDGHWAQAEILRLAKIGLLSGYQDGSFKPEEPLARAEMAVVLCRLLDYLAG